MSDEKRLFSLGKKHYEIQKEIKKKGLEGCDAKDLRKQQNKQIENALNILSSNPDLSPGTIERVKRLFQGK